MAKDYDIVAAFQKIEEELINSMLGNIKDILTGKKQKVLNGVCGRLNNLRH